MTRKFLLLSLVGLFVSGCTVNPYYSPTIAPVYGPTIAQGALRTDVFRMLPAYAQSPDCHQPIERVDVELLDRPKELSPNQDGNLNSGVFKERWLVMLCGKQKEIFVTFRPRGTDTFITLSHKP
jgi:hypothetical protein